MLTVTAFLGKLSSRKRQRPSLRELHAKQQDSYGTYKDGTVTVNRSNEKCYSLYYRIYSADKDLIPLAVLHGGPSLPSQYLYPIVPHLDDRPILFYDQLGCGRSDEPKDLSCYSMEQSVEDLGTVLSTLGYDEVHLLGHSYGGALAYEALPQLHHMMRSLILANTNTNMKYCSDEYSRLSLKNPADFWNKHVCRCSETPPALDDALRHTGSVWGGMGVVIHWTAKPYDPKIIPPTLLLSGEYDFGAKASEGWKDLLPSAQSVVMENCAHYPHLEDGATFGRIVKDFLIANDEGSRK